MHLIQSANSLFHNGRVGKIFLLPLLCLSAFFTSCEVEFSPNGDWQETPVVYALLDQDDDTTYVRVQKCFLGDGNQYIYAPVRDSNYYPAGSLTVTLEEWASQVDNHGLMKRTGDAPLRVFPMQYMELTDKEEGTFNNQVQPVYALPTAGLFDTNCVYRVVVMNNLTGKVIASGETALIRGEMILATPNEVVDFSFSGRSGECTMTWTTLREARQYRPIVRFNYRDFIIDTTVIPYDTTITPHYIDIPGNTVKSNMTSRTVSSVMTRSFFLSCIKSALEGNTCNKNIIDTVDITILCCSEAFTEYLFANNPAGTLNQEPFSYSNVDGGLGVIAARRRHISFKVKTPGVGAYVNAIKELGVGF